jgi:predicted neuraminidase
MTTFGRVRPTATPGRAETFLPSPCIQNHAANLAALSEGELVCVWFGGTQEGLPDTFIYLSRLDRHRDEWTQPVRLSDDPERSEQNPVLFRAPDGLLWLLYTAQQLGHQDTAVIRQRTSIDGREWTSPKNLLPDDAIDGGQFIRQPPVVLGNGDWLLPIFVCHAREDGRWNGDKDTSAVMISTDHGESWTSHTVPDSTGLVHMNAIALPEGELVALFRSRWADNIYRSRSTDGGRSWSAPQRTELPNNNSSIQAIRLIDGRLALAFNNTRATYNSPRRASLYDEIDEVPRSSTDRQSEAVWGTPRAPLTVAFSADGGERWPEVVDLELGDGYCLTNNSRDGLNRELSYPSIVQTSDGDIHVAFTYHRRSIKYVRLTAAG